VGPTLERGESAVGEAPRGLKRNRGQLRLVGAAGFEPATTRTPSVCATRLRHAPTVSQKNTEQRPQKRPFDSNHNRKQIAKSQS
jgi:hypothetical protein